MDTVLFLNCTVTLFKMVYFNCFLNWISCHIFLLLVVNVFSHNSIMQKKKKKEKKTEMVKKKQQPVKDDGYIGQIMQRHNY